MWSLIKQQHLLQTGWRCRILANKCTGTVKSQKPVTHQTTMISADSHLHRKANFCHLLPTAIGTVCKNFAVFDGSTARPMYSQGKVQFRCLWSRQLAFCSAHISLSERTLVHYHKQLPFRLKTQEEKNTDKIGYTMITGWWLRCRAATENQPKHKWC